MIIFFGGQLYSALMGVMNANNLESSMKAVFEMEPNPYKLWKVI